MGLIKILKDSIGGAVSDQLLEAYQPSAMGETTVFAPAVAPHTGNNQHSSTDGIISNGSIIQVYDGQMMILVDGGRVVDYTAEPGYFKVDNSSMPSMLNGQFKDSFKDVWTRIKFGGTTPQTQRAYYINLQEIKGIRFGTPNPINYYDAFYNAELRIKIHGVFSIVITNPLLFYENVVPKEYVTQNRRLDFSDIESQFKAEFVSVLGSAIGQYTAAGESVRFITSKGAILNQYMQTALDDLWVKSRGIDLFSVAVSTPSYDEQSQKLIDKRNDIAMQASAVATPQAQAAYLATAAGRAMENAGANEAGAMQGFLGLGMAMNQGSNILSGYQQQMANQPQSPQPPQAPQAPQSPQPPQAPQPPQPQQTAATAAAAGAAGAAAAESSTWKCECGAQNTGRFCQNCGKPKPQPQPSAEWTCECGAQNSGRFCQNCGKPKPQTGPWKCPDCGTDNSGRFCQNCGKPRA